MRRFLSVLVIISVAATLPFIVMVRGSLWLYSRGWPEWIALAAALLGAAGVMVLVAWVFIRRLPRRVRWRHVFLWLALPATVGFAGQGLLSLAATRAKTASERADWRRTHPLLRMSVATLALLDGDLVVTDLARASGDYQSWGLPVFERSQHVLQPDGYVHAMDLRTRGRSRLRNGLVHGYFWAMGFRTLRHVGTADHLHVGLPSRL